MHTTHQFLTVLIFIVVMCPCLVFSHPASYDQSASAVADTNIILPPAWAFGIIYGAYTNQQQTVELIGQIIAHDYPIDGFWNDSWIWEWQNKGKGPAKYMDFTGDTVSYPDLQSLWNYMEMQKIKSGMWMWDCILRTGNEAIYDDFKSRDFFSNTYIRTDSWHNGGRTTIIGDHGENVNGTWCGDIDFRNPEAVRYFALKAGHFFEKGLDFIKLDKTAEIPVCKAMFELTANLGRESKGRGFILSHSSGTEDRNYKRYPAKWTDDTRSDWTIEKPLRVFSEWLPQVAFKENLAFYTNPELPQFHIPFLSNDMGGFAVSEDGYVDEELYIRWLQFAVFLPLTTPFSQPENLTGNIAFKVSDRADKLFRDYSHLKMELFPYIYSYAHRSRLDGINVIRAVKGHPYQYSLGNEILVAPVYEQGAVTRKVYLPPDASWINFWDNEVLAGGKMINTPATLEQIPIFIKQGAIIPRRKYTRSIAAGTNDLLELHIYEGSDGKFSLIEDDGLSNDYLKGIFATTEISQHSGIKEIIIEIQPVRGSFMGMKSSRQWQIFIYSPKGIDSITINGQSGTFARSGNHYVTEPFYAAKSEVTHIECRFTKK